MSSEQAMREAAKEAGVVVPLRFEEVTESTNSTAMKLAYEGAEEWTLVVAGHQTGGRGRLGRTWISEPGQALLFSVVLRPELDAAQSGLMTLLAGAAMAEAARVSCAVKVTCKWPNDLMVGDGKTGGILAESAASDGRLDHVVLGVGMNVGRAPADVPGAASLSGGDPSVLLSAFLWCFKHLYHPTDPDFAPKTIDACRAVSATIGRKVRAQTLDGRAIEGVAIDLDERGNLLVDSSGTQETVGFGEIAHLDP